ncbi:hypothetical protein [Paraflavitalea speifideaquila]|uniref:hypothetical protein n=1 Tax=Paraflavitalea speifideaquila TaxID=3076558 RepID=UPI0028E22F58|nr:hypothetical protein [Paraflavitalea speifideiaquila]
MELDQILAMGSAASSFDPKILRSGEMIQEILNMKDPAKKMEKIEDAVKFLLTLREKSETAAGIIPGQKTLPDDGTSGNAPTPSQDKKVDTIIQTIYNRYGNDVDLPWPPGGSRAVGIGKDSVGDDGKTYHVKKVYKTKNNS